MKVVAKTPGLNGNVEYGILLK